MQLRELTQQAVDAFNKHDAAGFAATYSTDAVVYDPQYEAPLRGRDAIEKDMADLFRAFPDIHSALMSTVENGSVIVAEWSMSGTHKGPLPLPTGEIPATSKPIRLDAATVSRVNSDGEVVEERRYFDLAGLLNQIGALS